MKYYPRIKPDESCFLYEYWWVTSQEIYGARLVKVRIPPSTGPCNKKSFFEFYEVGLEDGKIYSWSDLNKFLWVDYIPQPDTSFYDRGSKVRK